MGYDGDFYVRYAQYLLEDRVRDKHDVFLDMWGTLSDGELVVDLGCGASQEYRHHGPGYWYVGYDVNAEPEEEIFDRKPMRRVMRADYRSLGFVDVLNELKTPRLPASEAFVSLFSSECTADAATNQELYERLFLQVPTLQRGLVAGFYYMGRRDQNPLEETGGITSWQTVASIEESRSDVYDEVRMVSAVPSTMFGEDVVEVWRILTRR